MEFEVAKDFIKETLTASGSGLSRLEEIALEAAWDDVTYEVICEKYDVNTNTLKGHISPILWKKLSQFFLAKITKKKFRAFCEEKGDTDMAWKPALASCKRIVGAAFPNLDQFYGREAELVQMQQLVSQCPCVLVVGAEGIGKRSLVAKFLRSTTLALSQVIWRPLHHRPTAGELEVDLLELLEAGDEKSLISALKEKRAVIVLESLDALIPDGHRTLAPEYISLIRRVMEETDSKIIGIATEPIEQIKLQALRGKAAIYTLGGLGLEESKLIVNGDLGGRIEELWQAVGGNPLALKQVAEWVNDTRELDPVLANRLTVHRGLVSGLYEQTFRGRALSTVDRALLIAIAANKSGIPFSKLLNTHPNSALEIQRLIDMGLVQKTSQSGQSGGAIIKTYEFFRQYLIGESEKSIA
jgi:hypothetical protein